MLSLMLVMMMTIMMMMICATICWARNSGIPIETISFNSFNLFFKIYFIDYATTVVPFPTFVPLHIPPPA